MIGNIKYKMTTITNDTEDINYKIVNPYNNTNRQIIISKNIEGQNIAWNFNADQREDVMGKLHSKMDQLFNLSKDNWYKRIIYDDFNSIEIIEMNAVEIQQYQQEMKSKKNEYLNHMKGESKVNQKDNNMP
jgi:hypothetical protein